MSSSAAAANVNVSYSVSENLISLVEVTAKVPNRKTLHTALVRNQFIIPPLKDPINTNEFMTGK